MTSQPLDIEIHRKGRKEDSFTATADPANPKELREILTGWLTGHKWGRGKWDQFELVAFEAGTWTRAGKVRAS